MTDSNAPLEGQISETAQATPNGGADGVPGTEDGTPTAAESHQARPGGTRDYGEDTAPRA